jgi:hypothetical protein
MTDKEIKEMLEIEEYSEDFDNESYEDLGLLLASLITRNGKLTR